jgi:hypothetical protein
MQAEIADGDANGGTSREEKSLEDASGDLFARRG